MMGENDAAACIPIGGVQLVASQCIVHTDGWKHNLRAKQRCMRAEREQQGYRLVFLLHGG